MSIFRRLIVVLFAISLSVATTFANPLGQRSWRYGVIGGANLTKIENYGGGTYSYFNSKTSWHAGLTAQYNWGDFLSYSVQPELKYVNNCTFIEPVIGGNTYTLNLGTIELPANFQFGLRLSPIFRPFVQAGVVLSYIVSKDNSYPFASMDQLNRFNFGLGAGVGVDLWKFQIQCKYQWGLTKINKSTTPYEKLGMEGFTFSIAVLL